LTAQFEELGSSGRRNLLVLKPMCGLLLPALHVVAKVDARSTVRVIVHDGRKRPQNR